MTRPVIVAEIGGSHNGSLDRARQLVIAAAQAGASAVKFQCFTPEQMCAPDKVLEDGPWKGRNLLDLYRQTHTPREWFPLLFKVARNLGITPFASVFHQDDVDFLQTLDCPIFKISSFELTDLDLIRHASRTAKPIVLSIGMASWVEICCAMSAVYPYSETGVVCASEATLLQCTSAYPADASDANLATMVDLAGKAGGWNIGLSDHTPGIGVSVAAVVLGASMIEKHLTLRRSDGGPDAAFSMEPEEFAQLVVECNRAAVSIGTVRYGPAPSEAPSVTLRRPTGGKRGDVSR